MQINHETPSMEVMTASFVCH